jgi:hypothetical protein
VCCKFVGNSAADKLAYFGGIVLHWQRDEIIHMAKNTWGIQMECLKYYGKKKIWISEGYFTTRLPKLGKSR